MACSCHGKSKVRTVKTLPTDQCTACARKHSRDAWSAYLECAYEIDNREFVAGQLRDAMRHLQREHRATALRCRDLAMQIEEARDVESVTRFAEELDNLRKEILDLFFADHPETVRRLARLQNNMPNSQ